MGYLYSLYCLEKPSEKPRTHQRGSPTGQPYGAPKRYLSAHLTLRLPAKFALGALLEPLFGQFQNWYSRKLTGLDHGAGPTSSVQSQQRNAIEKILDIEKKERAWEVVEELSVWW